MLMAEGRILSNLIHKKHYRFFKVISVDNETQQKEQRSYIQHTAKVDLVEVADGLYIK